MSQVPERIRIAAEIATVIALIVSVVAYLDVKHSTETSAAEARTQERAEEVAYMNAVDHITERATGILGHMNRTLADLRGNNVTRDFTLDRLHFERTQVDLLSVEARSVYAPPKLRESYLSLLDGLSYYARASFQIELCVRGVNEACYIAVESLDEGLASMHVAFDKSRVSE